MIVASKDSEIKLVEFLSGLRDDQSAWRLVYFRFSQLRDQYKSEYQSVIAVNLIRDYVQDADGGVFLCGDHDIFLVCKGVSKTQLDKLIFRLRYLFYDDALAYSNDGRENNEFCSVHDLTIAWKACYDMARQKLLITAGRDLRRSIVPEDTAQEAETLRPLTPERLVGLEREIRQADLSRVMRHQPVCAARALKKIVPVFEEYYINIAHLRKLTLAEVDFFSNRWLFKYLTQLLDHKMLELLARRPKDFFSKPASINLNVDTILSQKFTEFDSQLKESVKKSIVIEVHISDIFFDTGKFMVAKDALQRLGYRVCLDGVTMLSFLQIDRKGLGVDLAKLQWNVELERHQNSLQIKELIGAIDAFGPNRIILCHCDSSSAVNFGQDIGIVLFQGRYLDSVVDPNAKVVN